MPDYDTGVWELRYPVERGGFVDKVRSWWRKFWEGNGQPEPQDDTLWPPPGEMERLKRQIDAPRQEWLKSVTKRAEAGDVLAQGLLLLYYK